MKLIIDVPEELYESYKGRPPMLGDAGMDMIAQAIAKGILLEEYLQALKDCGFLLHSVDVLDKIRAELMLIEGMEDAIEIIDKYKAERGEE